MTTVTQVAEADREASKKLIAARQQIEQDKLRSQTGGGCRSVLRAPGTAEADQRSRRPEQADARRVLAEADSQAKELVARGEKAQQMVAVEVAREQVNVEQAKVQVERQQLENRQEFAEAGIQLEIQRLTISANRDVQVEFAKSLASFLSSGHMTLYGTPETASTMLNNMAKGFGLRSMIDGFVNGASGNGANGIAAPETVAGNGHARNGQGEGSNGALVSTGNSASGNGANNGGTDAVGAILAQVGTLLQPAIAKVTGKSDSNLSPEDAQSVARSLADNPAFLAALQSALTASATTANTASSSAPATETLTVIPPVTVAEAARK